MWEWEWECEWEWQWEWEWERVWAALLAVLLHSSDTLLTAVERQCHLGTATQWCQW